MLIALQSLLKEDIMEKWGKKKMFNMGASWMPSINISKHQKEKNHMEKKKVSLIKIVNTVLGIAVIICIIVNVKQFNHNNTLKNEISVMEKDIEALQTERDGIDNNLESEKESLSDLSKQIDTLNEEITTLKTENQSLLESLSELEKTKQALEESRLEEEKEKNTTVSATTDTGSSDNKSTVTTDNSTNTGNAEWSGGNGDATSNFMSKFQGASPNKGNYTANQGVHAE